MKRPANDQVNVRTAQRSNKVISEVAAVCEYSVILNPLKGGTRGDRRGIRHPSRILRQTITTARQLLVRLRPEASGSPLPDLGSIPTCRSCCRMGVNGPTRSIHRAQRESAVRQQSGPDRVHGPTTACDPKRLAKSMGSTSSLRGMADISPPLPDSEIRITQKIRGWRGVRISPALRTWSRAWSTR